MKMLLMLAALVLFAGCSTAPKNPKTAGTILLPGQVPHEVIRQIPARAKALKKGMTEGQVFQALGLFDVELSGEARGPMERNMRAYELCPGCDLNLIFDARQRPATLLSYRLEGEGWKKI